MKTKKLLPQKIANVLSKKIIYYCAIRVWLHATTGKYGDTLIAELTMDEAIRRWDNKKRGE